jgi:uncharacterized membrane-anchored protein
MRNNIDNETYTWFNKVFFFLGGLLLIANTFMYFSNDPSYILGQKIGSATLLLLVAAFFLMRIEYLKIYEEARYKARRVPMWASVFVFVFFAIYRLF